MSSYFEKIEALADLEHDRWSRWQRYLHSKCDRNEDGSLTIPADSVKHWERQMATPYAHLTPREQDSNRKEASQPGASTTPAKILQTLRIPILRTKSP